MLGSNQDLRPPACGSVLLTCAYAFGGMVPGRRRPLRVRASPGHVRGTEGRGRPRTTKEGRDHWGTIGLGQVRAREGLADRPCTSQCLERSSRFSALYSRPWSPAGCLDLYYIALMNPEVTVVVVTAIVGVLSLMGMLAPRYLGQFAVQRRVIQKL